MITEKAHKSIDKRKNLAQKLDKKMHDRKAISNNFTGNSPRKKIGGCFFILLIAVAFLALYHFTFKDSPISRQTHGPFNFECGIYRNFALGYLDPLTTDNNKLLKHLLCAVGYPVIYQVLGDFSPLKDTPFVCSLLTGLMILIFGLWLYWRTDYSPVVIPVILLLGLSFTTWYVGSVWESRSFIALGAVILLICLDSLIRKPSGLTLAASILAMVFSLLITIGNAYLVPLLPVSLLLAAPRLGLLKSLRWSVFSIVLVVLLVALTYQAGGHWLNPNLNIGRMLEIARHEQDHINASWEHLGWDNYLQVSCQVLLYSVGGIRIIPSSFMGQYECIWSSPDFISLYFRHFNSVSFLITYAVLIAITLVVIIGKNLFYRQPLLVLIGFWIFCYISFFVYFNPTAGPVYAAELQPLLWTIVALSLRRLRARWTVPFLLVCALLIGSNNWSVIKLFREYYGENQKGFLTRGTYPTRGRYNLWIWAVRPELHSGTRVTVRVAHPLAGQDGGFHIVAWADTDGDNTPDREIARSPFLTSPRPGDWSSFKFETEEKKIYVGNSWPPDRFMLVYRSNGDWPPAIENLENYFYYRQGRRKLQRAGPAVTNMKVDIRE